MNNDHSHTDNLVDGNKIIRHYKDDGLFMDLSVDQTIAKKLNRWQGWACAAGVDHIYIGYDGDVYRGNCRMGGSLGNIFADFRIPQDWIICQHEYCGCGSDVMTAKVKAFSHSQLLKNRNQQNHQGPTKKRDEIQGVVAVETAFRPPPLLRIQWDVGRRCNYNCSYCWPDVHSKTEAIRSYEEMQLALGKLKDKLPKGYQAFFQFGGGEPTLIPNFLKLITELRNEGHRIVVTSNGSRNSNFWQSMIRVSSVNISVHFEFADLEKLIENFTAMTEIMEQDKEAGRLEIKLMCPPGTVKKAQNFRLNILQIPNIQKYTSLSFVPIRYGITDKKMAARMLDYQADELAILQSQLV